MTGARLELTREQVLGHRRRAGALDERLPWSTASLRLAAWAGLPDSMPRAALVALHARVSAVGPDALADPTLSQVWGPRFSDYVVAEEDAAIFTLGRLPPGDGAPRQRAEAMADRLDAFLAGRRMPYGQAGRGIGVHPNMLRYGTATGRLRIEWDGARQPIVWTVPRPRIDPLEAKAELARRYLHVLGPGTIGGFGQWAGLRLPKPAFEHLAGELLEVHTLAGDGWILQRDEAAFREAGARPEPNVARLLPSGDTYVLCWGADRELVVPDAGERGVVWTSRVWPGLVLVGGEIVGTWRRAEHQVAIRAFRELSADQREAIETEATALPLPGLKRAIALRWES